MKNAQKFFEEFWDIACDWRADVCLRPGAAAREFHRRVKEGIDPQVILNGARNYTNGKMQEIEPRFRLQPHNWLADHCWTEYQEAPRSYRPLTMLSVYLETGFRISSFATANYVNPSPILSTQSTS